MFSIDKLLPQLLSGGIYISYTTGREYRRENNRYLMSSISLFAWSRHNCLVIVTSSTIDCDVISKNDDRASGTRGRCVKIVVLSSFMDSLCRVRNKIMYVLSWRTVSVLTRVLFWYLFPSLLRNSGNKHQYNLLVSAETFRHSSTYIILYVFNKSNDRVYGKWEHEYLSQLKNISEVKEEIKIKQTEILRWFICILYLIIDTINTCIH